MTTRSKISRSLIWTIVPTLILCLFSAAATAQVNPHDPEEDHSYKPLMLKVSEDGNKYIRFLVWNQFWARHNHTNPGTVDGEGAEMPYTTDMGLRRARFLVYAQVSSRFLILSHWGINNQSYINGGGSGTGGVGPYGNGKKPQLFMHDFWNEITVVKDKLYIGSGLHYWLGISRLSNGSTLTFMTLDAPIFNWPLIEISDQFARQFGVYAKGKLGKLDYRMAVNKPFYVDQVPTNPNVAIDTRNESLALAFYHMYQFKDQESNKLPYTMGSYLGTKEIFNIGFGGHIHNNATASIDPLSNNLEKHNMRLFGLDLFWEKPLNRTKGMATSLYSVLYRYDFGPNYLRHIGIMNMGRLAAATNPISEFRALSGAGNAQPTIGTGIIQYTQFGLLLPKLNNGTQLMPYVSFTYKDFEALNSPSGQYDLGLNYLINGHQAKVTMQYSQRPLYNTNFNRMGNRGEFIIQTHLYL